MITREVLNASRNDTCNCMPTCTTIEFDTAHSIIYMDDSIKVNLIFFWSVFCFHMWIYLQMSLSAIPVSIRYNKLTFFASTRSELFDQTGRSLWNIFAQKQKILLFFTLSFYYRLFSKLWRPPWIICGIFHFITHRDFIFFHDKIIM